MHGKEPPVRWTRKLEAEIVACTRCPRLIRWCRAVASDPPPRHRGETYWAKPVPGFGDPRARLCVVGLAPAAHGANRTGRMFSGDASGGWLYRVLHRFGWANRPTSSGRDDGLQVRDVWITAALRCAPPQNRPFPGEIASCRPFLGREIANLRRAKVYLALGRVAYEAFLPVYAELCGEEIKPRPTFAHGKTIGLSGPEQRGGGSGRFLLLSYHPSRQNTQTGRLTWPMWEAIFARAAELLARG